MSNLKIGGQNVGKIYLGDMQILGGGVNDLRLKSINPHNLYVINNTDVDVQIKRKQSDVTYDVSAGSVFTINEVDAHDYINVQAMTALTTSIASSSGSMVGTINGTRNLAANTTFLQAPTFASATVYILNIIRVNQ